jgi:hypothetical protein
VGRLHRGFGSRIRRLRLLDQRKIKKPHRPRTIGSWQASYFSDPTKETPMRALSYVIALILLLTGPSLAGTPDGDLPGIGTFTYNGSPVPNQAATVMAALGR